MPVNKPIIILYFAFFSSISYSQTNCGTKDDKPLPDAIFGPDPLWAYGPDTLITNAGRQVIYFCEFCKINGYNKKGKLNWSKDLREFKCTLRTFNYKNGGKIKGGNIILQFKGPKIYSLNSRTGKIHLLTEADIETYKSKAHPKTKMSNKTN